MAGLLYVRTGSGGGDAAFQIDDLGFTVPTGAGWTLLSASSPLDPLGNTGQFTARDLRDSSDLFGAITGGNLEWSKDGATQEPANTYISDYMLSQDLSDDFLDLGDGRLGLPHGSTLPVSASGIEGEVFWDSDDDVFYIHNGVTWVNPAASGVDHGSLGGLLDDDHTQYLLLTGDDTRNAVTGSIDMSSSTGVLVVPQAADVINTFAGVGEEGAIAWDTDDDILYAHDGTNWIGIAPASGIITDHGGLTGLLDDDHTQYGLLAGNEARNAVTGKYDFSAGELGLPTYVDVPASLPGGNEGDIAWDSDDDLPYFHDGTQWLTINQLITSGLDHGELDGLLDDDHTQYGLLAGNAARNDVSGEYDFTDGDLILPSDGTLKGSPVEGNVEVQDGILYAYDSTRTKWLSVNREQLSAGKVGHANDVYLRGPGDIATSQTGFRAIRDGTIVGLSAQTDDAETWTLEIRRNGVTTPIATLAISAAAGDQDGTINIDFDEGDELQFYANTTGNIQSPIANMEFAWRTS